MNLIDILKQCEPNISQIARDCGVTRAAPGLWVNGHIPSESTFNALVSNEKYTSALANFDYGELRKKRPVGRPVGSLGKKSEAA